MSAHVGGVLRSHDSACMFVILVFREPTGLLVCSVAVCACLWRVLLAACGVMAGSGMVFVVPAGLWRVVERENRLLGKNVKNIRGVGRVAGAALAAFAVGAPLAAAGVNAAAPSSHVGEIGAAYAERKPDTIPVAASNEFNAYVKAGEQLWIDPALSSGVQGVTDQGGKAVSAGADGYYPAATADGVWKIAYRPVTDVSGEINGGGDKGDQDWHMGVYSGNNRHPGRLWVKRLHMSQRFDGGFSESTLGTNAGTLTMYPVSSSGYVYKLELKGINGIESVIAATSSGINKVSTVDGQTVYTPTNKSLDTWYVEKDSGLDAYAPSSRDLNTNNWLLGENYNEAPSSNVYNMFFEEPSKDLPESIVPKVKTIADANVTWTGDTPTSGNGYATITGLDPEVTYAFEAAGKTQEFTGSDSAKVRVEAGDSIEKVKWKLTAKSRSQLHIMLDDVERLGGITITQVNGGTAGDATVYWDDSNLSRTTFDSRPTGAASALDGVNSATEAGVHGWYGVTDARANKVDERDFGGGNAATYGDGRIIDTWANSGEERDWEGEFEIKQPNPHISIVKTVDEPQYAEGDTLHWRFKVTNDGETILNDVKVVEDEYTGTSPLTDVSCPVATLAIGESMDCSATSVASAQDVDADKIENTAHPEGNDPSGKRVKGDPSKAVTNPKPKPQTPPTTPPTTPPATPPTPVTPPATPPAPQESKPAVSLPVTGASAAALVGGVGLLAGGGAAGVAAARRRGK